MKSEKPSLVIQVVFEPNRLAQEAEADAYQTLYPEKGTQHQETGPVNFDEYEEEKTS